MDVIGRMCLCWSGGGWVFGKVVKHSVKEGFCIVETKRKGTVKVKSSRVQFTDRNDWDADSRWND